MSDSKLNNLGGASSEHGFFIRSVMANGNGWLLYSLVVTILCSFHGLLQKCNITKTIWVAKLNYIINLNRIGKEKNQNNQKNCLLNVLWKKLDQFAKTIDRQYNIFLRAVFSQKCSWGVPKTTLALGGMTNYHSYLDWVSNPIQSVSSC